MHDERIEAALRHATDTRHVVFHAGALSAVPALFERGFGAARAVIVADENTFAAAGAAVERQLLAAGRAVEAPIIFPAKPALYADFVTVQALEAILRIHDAIPIAVGSGTINDITKLAAHRVGRPYMCVGTAASMDGYTAFGAAITKDGFKQTMPCSAPRVVLADLRVLAAAPPALHAAGYGDLLGKITAGADWILADALGTEPIDRRAWSLVQDPLRGWLADPAKLQTGDLQAIERLFEGLIMAGVAMQISQSSRPASGSEHHFSHLWEMQALGHGHPPVPHGFKVGIGTLAATALYAWLPRDLSSLPVEDLCRTWPTQAHMEHAVRHAHDLPMLAERAAVETVAKYLSPEQLRARLLLIQERWPIVREQIAAQLLPLEQVQALLRAAGCPTDPLAIGVSVDTLRASYALARTIRSRYTMLELVYETGLLDAAADALFAPDGFWGAHGDSGMSQLAVGV